MIVRGGLRGLGRRAGFGLLTAAGLWLLLESACTLLFAADLRAWAQPPPAPDPDLVVMPGHPYLIYAYRPGAHEERGVRVHINSLGLRGPELRRPKPAGARRLLATGDSSVFGFGVDEAQTFTAAAARALGVEPVNAGLPGYSTFQTQALLSLRAWEAAPDLVLIGNLWSDNTFDTFVDKEVIATLREWESGPVAATLRLLQRSAVFRVADWRLRVRPRAERVKTVSWRQDRAEEGRLRRRRVEINDYGANLYAIAREAQARGAGVAFVVLPNREDLEPKALDRGADGPAWGPYREAMRAAAAAFGAPLIDGPAAFAASGQPADALFLDEMHPSAAGHALLGAAVAEGLAAAGWPARPLDLRSPADPPQRVDPHARP